MAAPETRNPAGEGGAYRGAHPGRVAHIHRTPCSAEIAPPSDRLDHLRLQVELRLMGIYGQPGAEIEYRALCEVCRGVRSTVALARVLGIDDGQHRSSEGRARG